MKPTFTTLQIAFLFLFISFKSFSQTYAENGMVVSDHVIASQVGVDILKKGGNAIDAAVATAFALEVTHPEAGNIGGGGFIVFMKSDGNVTTFDFREKAPLAASPTMFLDENGKIKDNSNHQGLLAVGVPGTVAGLYQAHQKYGKLPWADLVKPAVELAKKGFTMSWGLYNAAVRMTDRDPSEDIMQNYFKGKDGKIVKPGETWKQPALAKTLKEIQKHGRNGFYKGWVAQEIEDYMKANGGIITKADLEKYEAVEREPVKGTFNGYEIYSMPPPSSGGVALIEMMNLMEQANIAKVEFNSTAYVHLVAEAMRRAFADRAEHLGDPDFNPDMPLDRLLSKEFAKKRFETLDMTKASISDPAQFGHPYGGDNTTHFSVVDKDGNAISMTYTLENSYGVKMGSDKLGFIFNNEMGDFNPVPGETTATGQIGSNPNLVAPEKRMLSSMTPTIVAKDGKPYLVIGSPGGRTIINTVFQTVLNVLAYDMRVDRAIEAMKIHHQWLPDRILYERNLLSPDTREALEKMGHTLTPTTNLGVLMGITYDASKKLYTGAADSSSEDGGARGY
ncbi:gamma-glutamyltransferase [Algoriphagus halophytocola]|uniref:Glutathione hydrolase proenzyme n=1 Tax=Algoriphagus halophytocola TaxID=2991499 RepID=A0ABY6MCG7_9BACT|nr:MULTISPECIES: gamma-glutamyltransferase [unclassified Algoriphagus]UZD21387.1 gamma-glutamyltransferase [Algoriphagus sp. TR-M5]WBL42599.1 gamma-glutamyltransferase [Algoriphagus sp. TR-M9]